MRSLIFILSLFVASAALAEPTAFQNEANTTKYSTAGTGGPIAMDSKGKALVSVSDSGSGETQSVIPVSNAVNLNGVGALGVGYYFSASDTVEAGSTTTVINATTHAARVGDGLSFRTGTAANIGVWAVVTAVTTNTITIANALPATPAAADGFYVLRPAPISINSNFGNSSYNSVLINADASAQISNATGLLKLEDAAAASGDAGVMDLGVRNTALTSLAADGDYIASAKGSFGQDLSTLVIDAAISTAATPIRQEDSVAASGDALVGVAGQINTGLATNAANGDYATQALGTYGNSLSTIIYDPSVSTTSQPVRAEDDGFAAGQALMMAGFQMETALTANAGTTGDVSQGKVDAVGRLITTLAPAGETWQSCTTQMTGTGDVSLKAAVASNRNYLTSLTCVNRSAVASSFTLKDGSTTIFIGGVGTQAATGGIFNQTFPVPLRGSVNTALNIAMTTTSTDTFCCASGYISVN